MNIHENIKILNEDIAKLSSEKITHTNAQVLSAYYGAKLTLESLLEKDGITTTPIDEEPTRANYEPVRFGDKTFFSSWYEFNTNHSEHNLKKLCLDIREFCVSVYATLQSEEEKKIYFEIIKNLTTF